MEPGNFITMFIRARHWSLSWARWIQSTLSYQISLTSMPILSCHPLLGLLSSLFTSGFRTKILFTLLNPPMRATCTANLVLIDLVTRILFGEAYKLWSSSVCGFMQPPATSTLLRLNILLSTLFSNTLSLCSSQSVRDQFSLPLP